MYKVLYLNSNIVARRVLFTFLFSQLPLFIYILYRLREVGILFGCNFGCGGALDFPFSLNFSEHIGFSNL